MPRTALPVTEVPFQAEIDNLTFTSADQPNGNMFDNDGKTVLVVKNTTGGPITLTVQSVADDAGRVGNLSVVVPATTGIGFVPPLRQAWFNQRAADVGKVYLDWSAAGATIAVLRLQP